MNRDTTSNDTIILSSAICRCLICWEKTKLFLTVYFSVIRGDNIWTRCFERLYVGKLIQLVMGRSGTVGLWTLGRP